MKIFDSHAHLGQDCVFDVEVNEQELIEIYDQYKITGALIQPFICRPYLEDTKGIHDRIFQLMGKFPSKFHGMISINPHLRHADVEEECTRCVKLLGFKGLKIAATAWGVSPSSKDGIHMFEIAKELEIAVMVHTGGGSFGNVMLLKEPLQKFPQIPVVIAHGGGPDGLEECIDLALRYEQVVVEPSWINILGVEKLLRILGPENIMFSSDMPQTVPVSLEIFRPACKGSQSKLEHVFYKTAGRVFSL